MSYIKAAEVLGFTLQNTSCKHTAQSGVARVSATMYRYLASGVRGTTVTVTLHISGNLYVSDDINLEGNSVRTWFKNSHAYSHIYIYIYTLQHIQRYKDI